MLVINITNYNHKSSNSNRLISILKFAFSHMLTNLYRTPFLILICNWFFRSHVSLSIPSIWFTQLQFPQYHSSLNIYTSTYIYPKYLTSAEQYKYQQIDWLWPAWHDALLLLFQAGKEYCNYLLSCHCGWLQYKVLSPLSPDLVNGFYL